jgi:hypothetical protein
LYHKQARTRQSVKPIGDGSQLCRALYEAVTLILVEEAFSYMTPEALLEFWSLFAGVNAMEDE